MGIFSIQIGLSDARVAHEDNFVDFVVCFVRLGTSGHNECVVRPPVYLGNARAAFRVRMMSVSTEARTGYRGSCFTSQVSYV